MTAGALFAIQGFRDWTFGDANSNDGTCLLAGLLLMAIFGLAGIALEEGTVTRLSTPLTVGLLAACSIWELTHAAYLRSPDALFALSIVFVAAGLWISSASVLAWTSGLSCVAGLAIGQTDWGDWWPAVGLLAASGTAGYQIATHRNKRLQYIESEIEALSQEAEEGRRLREVEEDGFLDRAVTSAQDGHWHWDLQTDKCRFSDNWAGLLGFGEHDLSDAPDEWLSRVHPHYLPQLKEDLSAHIYGRSDRFESQFRIQKRDGSYLWALARGMAQRDDNGNPTAVCGSLIDVTHLVQTEKSVLDDAFRDRLTGLSNRNAFMIRLERVVGEKADGKDLIALVFMDLDRFKVVNDTHGHAIGDQLLSAAASRLKGCLRQRSGDMLARLGGDEFVLLMEDISSQEDAVHVANRCLDALKKPFRIGENDIVSGGSIGIAFNNTDIRSAADLLRNADTAMYKAKANRKGEAQVFNQQMYEETLRVYELETELSQALGRGDFVLAYQPIVEIESGRIVAAEALLRWMRPNGSTVPPAEFIPIAEENGEIEAIGEWVLQQAVRQNVVWQRVGLSPIRVAVNLSPRQLQNSGFARSVELLLQREGLAPEWLELELTETAVMENLEEAAATISALQESGVDVSIDDFGTGYSSLGYLRRLSFNSLKMDRAFVADLTEDPQALAVAEGLVQLAHSLRLCVTAEGVESVEQLDILRRFGCDQLQGYLASRPLTVKAFGEALRSGGNLLAARADFAEALSGQ
jgi:diguanylate cyclase (GGDEF)-like protein/PAS domain S-box-containing protein